MGCWYSRIYEPAGRALVCATGIQTGRTDCPAHTIQRTRLALKSKYVLMLSHGGEGTGSILERLEKAGRQGGALE